MNPFARLAVAAIAIVLAVGGAPISWHPAGPGRRTRRPRHHHHHPRLRLSPQATAIHRRPPAVGERRRPPSADFVYPGTLHPRIRPAADVHDRPRGRTQLRAGFKCRGSIDANLPVDRSRVRHQPRIEVSTIVRVDKSMTRRKPGRPDRSAGRPRRLDRKSAWSTVDAQKAVQVGGLAATQLDTRTSEWTCPSARFPGVTDVGLGLGATPLGGPAVRRAGLWASDRHHPRTQRMARWPSSCSSPSLISSSGTDLFSRERLRPAFAQLAGLAGGVLGWQPRYG